MSVGVLDALLVAGVVVAAAAGAVRGAILQLAGVVGAIGGAAAGVTALPAVSARVDGSLRTLVVAFVVVGAAVLGNAAGAALGRRLSARVARAGAGGADRIAGAAVGAAGALVMVWLVTAALVAGPWAPTARWIASSRVAVRVDQALGAPPDFVGRLAAHLDREGFPQVTTRPFGVDLAPAVPPPDDARVAVLADTARRAVVQVEATGCGGQSRGSGAVVDGGGPRILTAAHVVAGADQVHVRDSTGLHAARVVAFDPRQDTAVLVADGPVGAPLAVADRAPQRGDEGVVLGFPGGDPSLHVAPATVRATTGLEGRDIYGRGTVPRPVLVLSADVAPGSSGGPLVVADDDGAPVVGGLVFAASSTEPGVGFALQPAALEGLTTVATDAAVPTGRCTP